MMESRGGITGGATINDFLRDFEGLGYTTQFVVRDGGRLECGACRHRLPADEVAVRSMRKVEGVSDPSDMGIVSALECPDCGARGTATFCTGAHCPPEDGEVLRRLHDERHSTMATARANEVDSSLVNDTGWLRGPDG
jgi:hypothetical protein